MKTRKYCGAEQWKAWILEWKDSGMQVKQWCESRGLSDNLFFRWRKRFVDKGILAPHTYEDTAPVKRSQPGTPSVVQVNFTNLDHEAGHQMTNASPGASFAESVFSTQVIIETPISGYRIYVGKDFSQDTLKRVMEVLT